MAILHMTTHTFRWRFYGESEAAANCFRGTGWESLPLLFRANEFAPVLGRGQRQRHRTALRPGSQQPVVRATFVALSVVTDSGVWRLHCLDQQPFVRRCFEVTGESAIYFHWKHDLCDTHGGMHCGTAGCTLQSFEGDRGARILQERRHEWLACSHVVSGNHDRALQHHSMISHTTLSLLEPQACINHVTESIIVPTLRHRTQPRVLPHLFHARLGPQAFCGRTEFCPLEKSGVLNMQLRRYVLLSMQIVGDNPHIWRNPRLQLHQHLQIPEADDFSGQDQRWYKPANFVLQRR